MPARIDAELKYWEPDRKDSHANSTVFDEPTPAGWQDARPTARFLVTTEMFIQMGIIMSKQRLTFTGSDIALRQAPSEIQGNSWMRPG